MQIVELHGLDGVSAKHFLVIGQVVGVHINTRCLNDGMFNLLEAGPIERAGYRADYAELTKMFEMQRPK